MDRAAANQTFATRGRCPIATRFEALRSPAEREAAPALPRHVRAALAGGGKHLPATARTFYESKLGFDFTRVRIHAGEAADASARALHAAAYTVGDDVVMRSAHDRWDRPANWMLVAHELEHVRANRGAPPLAGGALTAPHDAAERHADTVARSVLTPGLAPPAATHGTRVPLRLAPETWFRGEGVGVAPAAPGAHIHDFGDGLYLAQTQELAARYASERSKGVPGMGRVLTVTFERKDIGKVLDLTADGKWEAYVNKSLYPGGPNPKSLIKLANENYESFFKGFLKEQGIVDDFDVVIGPEYVRGGLQMCVREKAAPKLRALLKPVETPGGGTRGGSGGSEGGEGGGAAPRRAPVVGKRPTPPGAVEGEETAPRRPRIASEPHLEAPGPGLGTQIGISVVTMVFRAIEMELFRSAMDDALAKTPNLGDEKLDIGQRMRAPSDTAMKPMDLLRSNLREYADHGFTDHRNPPFGPWFARSVAVDTVKDDAARMNALNRLRLDIVNDIGELNRAKDFVGKALALEPAFKKRMAAATSLKKIIEDPIVAGNMIEHLGLSVEAWSALVSNLASYIAVHRLVLESLHKLDGLIDGEIASDNATLHILNEAAERNAHVAIPKAAPAAPAAPATTP